MLFFNSQVETSVVDNCSGTTTNLYPLVFSSTGEGAESYLQDPAVKRLIEFFEHKGLATLKQEDQREGWYEDWIQYQAKHRIYASKLSPQKYSSLGHQFDLLKLARFLEVFAYFSPAHGYSLHVSFLGLFPILMSDNEALKKEAIASLERGGLFAFGVSEKEHGSDLMSNEFTIRRDGSGQLLAEGSKYYIGNANAAGIISILARNHDSKAASSSKRTPFAFVALRPAKSPGFQKLRKIRTLGIRTAYVGEFDVQSHELPDTDIISQGRAAWDAMFATVTLGKFLLGFGSIGICEHAFHEAFAHLSTRVLFNRPVIEMPHVQQAAAHAYARLTAMKLFAYRALDYLHAAADDDRRYLLFNAVQKAKVGTEGVKVVAQLSECIGAKGFEADTYFESALRDIQLIPSLEGSTHVNYTMTTQFLSAYLFNADDTIVSPPSLTLGQVESQENAYLLRARTGGTRSISFNHFLRAYRPLLDITNVRLFVKQAKAFRLFVLASEARKRDKARVDWTIALGRCLSTIAYAQLIAENAVLAQIPNTMMSVIFEQLVESLSSEALQLAALAPSSSLTKLLIERMDVRPQRQASDLLAVAELIARPVTVAV